MLSLLKKSYENDDKKGDKKYGSEYIEHPNIFKKIEDAFLQYTSNNEKKKILLENLKNYFNKNFCNTSPDQLLLLLSQLLVFYILTNKILVDKEILISIKQETNICLNCKKIFEFFDMTTHKDDIPQDDTLENANKESMINQMTVMFPEESKETLEKLLEESEMNVIEAINKKICNESEELLSMKNESKPAFSSKLVINEDTLKHNQYKRTEFEYIDELIDDFDEDIPKNANLISSSEDEDKEKNPNKNPSNKQKDGDPKTTKNDGARRGKNRNQMRKKYQQNKAFRK
ncbi:hypothetical protein SNEBB_009210, partial [Seison nebaliae]